MKRLSSILSKRKRKLGSYNDNNQIICSKCNQLIAVRDKADSSKTLAGHMRHCQEYDHLLFENDNHLVLSNTNLDAIDEDNISNISIENNDVNYDVEEAHNVMNIEINDVFEDCDDNLFNFQIRLHAKYEQTLSSLKINKQKNKAKAPTTDDTLDIYRFSINNSLSNSGIDDLLMLLQDITKRNNVTIPLPNNHKTLKRQCGTNIISRPSSLNNSSNCIFDLLQWSYNFDKELFPNHQNFVHAYSFNILQLISESLLNIDPLKFITEPDIRRTNDINQSRIYEDFTTGDLFLRLTNEVRCNGTYPKRTALCIGVTLDESHILSGKRKFTPVYFYILNAIDDAFKMILLGYAPSNTLPYTKSEVTKILHDSFKNNKGKKKVIKEVIEFHKRKFEMDYLYDIIKPILGTQLIGVKLRVGRFDNPNGYDIHSFIHLCTITGDTEELDYLSGTSHRSKNAPCHICLSNKEKCTYIYLDEATGEFRDDDRMQQIATHRELALFDHCKNDGKKRDLAFLEYENKAKTVGIKSGYNKLIDLFIWSNSRKIWSFYQSKAPDYLHTFIIGYIADAIAWAMICIVKISQIDNQYKFNMKYLDERIKHFPRIQSLNIFQDKVRCRFYNGISSLFKTDLKENDASGTNFFANGSLEAWKLPQLLLQLIFCINGNICPFNSNWSVNKNTRYKWNIGHVIINSLTSVLELHFCCRMKVLSGKAILSLNDVISNTRSQLSLLHMLKEDLMGTHKKYTGIKHHLGSHYPYYKMQLGADHRQYDTEMSENAHKIYLKKEFEKTNKQYHSVIHDMLVNHKIKMHFNNINSYKQILSAMQYIDLTNNDEIETLRFVDNSIMLEYIEKNNRNIEQMKLKKYSEKSYDTFVSLDDAIDFADNDSDTDEKFKSCWEMFKEDKICLSFPNAILCQHDFEKTANDFIIYCSGKHGYIKNKNINPKNVCDFVEIKYIEDDNESKAIAQVIRIFSFVNKKQKDNDIFWSNIFVMVCLLKYKPRNETDLSFSSYGYNINSNRNLITLVIPIESIIRTVLLKQCFNNNILQCNLSIRKSTIDDLEKKIFSSEDDSMQYIILTNNGKPEVLKFVNNNIYVEHTEIKNRNNSHLKNSKKTKLKNESDNINTVLVTLEDVIDFAENEKDEMFESCWEHFKEDKFSLSFPNAIRCQYEFEKTPNDFIIHCCGKHIVSKNQNINPKSVCDFVEIKYTESNSESTALAHIISIFSFTNKEEIDDDRLVNNIFVMVCWLKLKTRNESVLPYPSYGYNIQKNNQLYFGIVPIESIIRPAFLIQHSKINSFYWEDTRKKGINDLKSMIFYCIPYKRIVRDFCDNFVDFLGDYPNSERLKDNNLNRTEDNTCNELPMMLSKAQQQLIHNFVLQEQKNTDSDDDFEDGDDDTV